MKKDKEAQITDKPKSHKEWSKVELFKQEPIIRSPQQSTIRIKFPATAPEREVLNFCANNYLGLASHPRIIKAAHEALDQYGYGMASVRFICGTQEPHKLLEKKISEFYKTDDAILYSSCFDANGGLFEVLLGPEDAIITDSLNHASIIDGIRLCKAHRLIFDHANMDSLEEKLKEARGLTGSGRVSVPAERVVVATDGVFSMDGDIAKLPEIVALGYKYDAIIMVDDSHATGFLGKTGRGSTEYCEVMGEVDIITSTLGKALGGASGGFTTGRRDIIDLLRQRSRPYLFSNTLSPVVAAASIEAFDILVESNDLREKLMANTIHFRDEMTTLGFNIPRGNHPIVPILLGKFENDAELSQTMAHELFEEGIYVVGFYFPVVPRGSARIRVQLSASHSPDQVDHAITAFAKVGRKLKVIP